MDYFYVVFNLFYSAKVFFPIRNGNSENSLSFLRLSILLSRFISQSRSPLKNLTFLHSFISTWFTFFYVYVKSIFRPNHYFLLKKWTGVWTISVLTWRKMALMHACSLLTTTFITSASFYTVPWDGNTPWSLLTKKHWQLRHVRTRQMPLFN